MVVIASKEQRKYYKMHLLAGMLITSFVSFTVSIVVPACPFIAFLKLFRLAKDSGIVLLFISESAAFCTYYLHR